MAILVGETNTKKKKIIKFLVRQSSVPPVLLIRILVLSGAILHQNTPAQIPFNLRSEDIKVTKTKFLTGRTKLIARKEKTTELLSSDHYYNN